MRVDFSIIEIKKSSREGKRFIMQDWHIYTVLFIITTVWWTLKYGTLAGELIDQSRSFDVATVLMQGIGGILMLPLILVFMSIEYAKTGQMSLHFSQNPVLLGMLLFSCIFYAVNDRLQTYARAILSDTEATLVVQWSFIVLTISGVFFLNAPLGGKALIGVILIFVGVLSVLWKKHKHTDLEKKGLIAMFIAATAFGIAISIDAGISKEFNLPFFVAITLFVPAIMIQLTQKITVEQIKTELAYDGIKNKLYAEVGVLFGFMVLWSLLALQHGPVSVVAPLMSTTALIMNFFDKNKEKFVRNLIASLLVVVGTVLSV